MIIISVLEKCSLVIVFLINGNPCKTGNSVRVAMVNQQYAAIIQCNWRAQQLSVFVHMSKAICSIVCNASQSYLSACSEQGEGWLTRSDEFFVFSTALQNSARSLCTTSFAKKKSSLHGRLTTYSTPSVSWHTALHFDLSAPLHVQNIVLVLNSVCVHSPRACVFPPPAVTLIVYLVVFEIPFNWVLTQD